MLRDLSFHVVGVSHHTAGIELRERFAFSSAEVAAWLQGQAAAGSTALLLSTCNRCEIYWSGDHDLESWFRDFSMTRGGDLSDVMLRLDGEAAVRHLFDVAAGLDSQILGEAEILGQVRRAYDAARSAGTTNRVMDTVLTAALVAGRRARRETMLGRHPASVSSAAVDVAASVTGSLEGTRALVLGAGEVAEGVLRALRERGARTALVNRDAHRADALATTWGAVTGRWEELDSLLAAADIVFVATSAPHPVLTGERLAEAVRARPRKLGVFDLAVPRNVEPGARELPGIKLFDLDDLQELRCTAEGGHGAPALDEVRDVLEQELRRLDNALRARAAAPRLADLHRLAARLAEEEADAALAQLGDLDDRERQVVREMADRLVRRVLYPVSRSVRDTGELPEATPRP
jgi:glutamyl-tRNA reductase